ncbi:MAG: VacJ family lipoprotein [Sphingomonadaceae bacterium]|nr:VacJ family lipoprotein [Sphingomonadaceae bacterium]
MADRDPREEFNRSIWDVNQAADSAVIRPVADVYRTVAPRPVRSGVTNVFRNLGEPWSFVNNILQGNPGRAARNLGRLLVNSTIGIGGLFDVASEIGIEPAPEDFAQTLAVWGVGDGGYQVLPLFGPTTARGTVGTIVDFLANPTTLFLDRVANLTTLELWGIRGFDIVNSRANATETGVDAFLESSADPYAAARSAFFERREAEILNYDTAGFAGNDENVESSEDEAFEAALEELEADDEFPAAPAPEEDEFPADPGPE